MFVPSSAFRTLLLISSRFSMASSSLANKCICIVGATSQVARAVAKRFAAKGATLHLAARDEAEAERIGRDLSIRYERVSVSWSQFEAAKPSPHSDLLDSASSKMGRIDILVVAIGMMGNQAKAEQDCFHLEEIIRVNFTAVAKLLMRTAHYLEAKESGMIVAISSVAGDRGRGNNYAYGSAKAGLSSFLSGLRSRLFDSGVEVLNVKPGPIDTKMTFGMDDPPPLMADPENVAGDIVRAIEQRKDVCYTPSIWRYIMTVIRLIPTSIFKRLNF